MTANVSQFKSVTKTAETVLRVVSLKPKPIKAELFKSLVMYQG